MERTLRLVAKYSTANATVVTRHGKRPCCKGVNILEISKTNCVSESILAVEDMFGDLNYLLLGDVFYSDRSLKRMLSERSSMAFWGRTSGSQLVKCGHGEIFAVTFDSVGWVALRGSFNQVHKAVGDACLGNLWNALQHLEGVNFGSKDASYLYLKQIDDFTNDFDTPYDYETRKQIYQGLTGPQHRKFNQQIRLAMYKLGLL